MTVIDTPPPESALTVTQAIQQAVAHHQAGRLPEAESLYRAILNSQPKHSDANHNLGVIAVQMKMPAAGLLHFKAALEASPAVGQYWLSYIEALIQANQQDAARQVLTLGRQRGLQGEPVDALMLKLAAGEPAAPALPAAVEPATPKTVKKVTKPREPKPPKAEKPTKKSPARRGKGQGSLL